MKVYEHLLVKPNTARNVKQFHVRQVGKEMGFLAGVGNLFLRLFPGVKKTMADHMQAIAESKVTLKDGEGQAIAQMRQNKMADLLQQARGFKDRMSTKVSAWWDSKAEHRARFMVSMKKATGQKTVLQSKDITPPVPAPRTPFEEELLKYDEMRPYGQGEGLKEELKDNPLSSVGMGSSCKWQAMQERYQPNIPEVVHEGVEVDPLSSTGPGFGFTGRK